MGDLLLTATYYRDMYRSSVRNVDRLARVAGCMLLAELCQAQQARIRPGGLVVPLGEAPARDPAAAAVVRDLRDEPIAQPADKWLEYLALNGHATTLIWQRLIERGVAVERRSRWRSRGPAFTLTSVLATNWTRHYLTTVAEAHNPLPAEAVILWRALGELQLDGHALQLPAATSDRLIAAVLPTGLVPLFNALTRSLTHLSTHF
ncbi:GPP34 family phosphoprotein [Amycolatopsis lurida]